MIYRRVTIVFILLMGMIIAAALLLSYTPADRADVVVIGAGASGMSAALEAESLGARVILLEKMPYVGGNTVRATAGMNALDLSREDAGFNDAMAVFFEDVMASGHYENDPEMVKTMIEASGDALKWLTSIGADLSDVGILAGHSAARTYRPSGGQSVGGEIVRKLEAYLGTTSIDLRLENKATEILCDAGGAVCGVTVEDGYGRTYEIRASSVVIATGGFGGSAEVFVRYDPNLKGYATTNTPGATGDFIELAEGVGAKLVNLEAIQTHPTVSTDYGVLITEALRGNGGILVNNQGQRFFDELENRDILSTAILAQPEKEVYLLFNEAVRLSLAASDDYVDKDILVRADTLESLAAALRIDVQTLLETVETYNAYVAVGHDADFGREALYRSLETGPYYAVQVIPAVHYCMGGILIDSEARVLDASLGIIPGLFACGEATGGIHGENRLGGNSLLDAVVFGRIAGTNAARP